jgi:transposase-like protein
MATFKLEAVPNWQASGKSAAVVAKELGLAARSRLFARRQLLAAAGGSAAAGDKPAVSELQSQLDAALREIGHLREQRDIQKNRWASSNSNSSTVRSSKPTRRPGP